MTTNLDRLSGDMNLLTLADELDRNVRIMGGRFRFAYNKDIILRLEDQEVLDLFQKTMQSVIEFKGELNRVSGFLYQRKAQIGSIEKEHLAWKSELEVYAEKKVSMGCQKLYEYIPLLKDPKKIAMAYRYMVKIEILTRPIVKKYEELVKVLTSPLHHRALEFYKQNKRTCKDIKSLKVSSEQKIDRLTQVFKHVEAQIEKTSEQFHGKERCVVEETALLYEELLKFIKYTVGSFQVRVLANEENLVTSSDSEKLSKAYGHLPRPVSPVAPQTTVVSKQKEERDAPEPSDLQTDVLPETVTAGPQYQTKYANVGYQWVMLTPEATPEPSQDSEDRETSALGAYARAQSRYSQPRFGYPAEAYEEPEPTVSPQPQSQPGWFSSWSPLGSLFTSGSTGDLLAEPGLKPVVLVHRIDELVKSIERSELQLTGYLPVKMHQAGVSEELQAKIQGYLRGASSFRLHSEDDFRNGQMFTTQSGIGRYLSIKDQVENLRKIAQALAKLLNTIEERIGDLCGADLQPAPGFESLQVEKDFYEMIMGGLERLIIEQKAELAELPISGRVHAGWYYAAKLLSNVKETERYMGIFKTLVREDFLNFTTASNWLIDYLDPKDSRLACDEGYFTGSVAISRLYATIQSHHQLRRPSRIRSFSSKLRTMIYTTIEEIIAKQGPCTLQLSEEEQLIPGFVFRNSPVASLQEFTVSQELIRPEVLRRYLMKGFLKHLHFSATLADPEFEIVLDILQTKLRYGDLFDELIKSNQEFSRYFSAYVLHTDMFEYPNQIRLMGEVLYTLSQNEETNKLQKLFIYCQARQMLSTLYAQMADTESTQMQARLTWIRWQSEAILKRMEDGFPEYFSRFESIVLTDTVMCDLDPVFYKLVARCLYGSDKQVRMKANSHLVQLLQRLPTEDLPKDRNLIELLTGWALEHIVTEGSFTVPHGDFLLTKFFEEYLTDNNVSALWREKYGIGYMEVALYTLAVRKEAEREGFYSAICQKICTTRQMMDYEFWKQVVRDYKEFRAIFVASDDRTVGSDTYIRANDLLQEVLETFDALPTDVERDDEGTHMGIARWCLRDMREQFNARYVFKDW